MANNYGGFSYGSSQYNTAAASGYNAASVSYPAVTNATYANATAYQAAAVAAGNGSYAAGSAGPSAYGSYGNDYCRAALPSYDASKTYYQQASSNYNTGPPVTVSKTHYSAPPVKNINPIGTKPLGMKDKTAAGVAIKQVGNQAAGVAAATTTPAVASFSSYDAALYSAASMYAVQKHQTPVGGITAKVNPSNISTNWPPYRKSAGGPIGNISRPRAKPTPRPQQLHYCEVCKISCAGPQTYREHLEGQKHKKREASLKMQASAQTTSQNRGNNYHCELCDVTCTGTDAYAAHVRGAKHQKVIKLHQKLGKPIPPDEPKKLAKINFVPAAGTDSNTAATTGNAKTETTANENINESEVTQEEAITENLENIKPVGGEYIEEVKDDEGKILSFNCKLCDCKFNDPNAKEMHMKGRRHRLQYKRKVQPDLVVDFKPTPRQRRLAEARAQRALMQAHRNANSNFGDNHDVGGNYWDEQRRRAQYDDEYDYNNWLARSFGNQRFGGRMGGGPPPPFFGMIPGGGNLRRPESSDDRHAIARHAEIYPKEEELQIIQRIVSHTERALKYVSDTLADDKGTAGLKGNKNENNSTKDGRDNQMLSFQKDADSGNMRILKGVMRVGFLAKGLLLQGDTAVELVVLCAEKPTVDLLKRVANELPEKLKEVAGDNPVDYKIELKVNESAVVVSDDTVCVKILLTSPLLRESIEMGKTTNESNIAANKGAEKDALLPREPCLRALAELRHAKWFQARATGLQSCVMVIRILRDLCHRIQSWQALPQWSMELLVEKVISSAGFPISPGDCLRRIMEALASGFLINGPGILDPCEKEPTDALHSLTKQQREDLTVSAQLFLRYIAFRQVHKVLGMEQLPPLKFPMRPWRVNRKRRRSSGKGVQPGDNEIVETEECVSDEKIAKKDGEEAA